MEIRPRRTMTPRERTILRGVVRRNRPTWIVHVENATAAPLWMRNEMRSWLCREIEWTDDGEPTPVGRELETLIDVLGPDEHEDATAAAGGPRPTLGSYLRAASAYHEVVHSSRAADLAYPAAVVAWALQWLGYLIRAAKCRAARVFGR